MTGISDHLPQFIVFHKSDTEFKSDHKNSYYKDWKSFNFEMFKQSFEDTDWQNVLQTELRNPNFSFERFYNKLNAIISDNLPIKKLTKKQVKKQNKPWITREILKSMNERDHRYKKFLKEKDPILKEIFHNEYKERRNYVVNLSRQSKTNYFKRYFEDNLKNSKKIWKGISEIVNMKRKKDCRSIHLEINKQIESDPKKVCAEFNRYFTSEPENIVRKIHPSNVSYVNFLKNRSQKSFFFSPISAEEVKKVILNLETKKSNGLYSILIQIMKMIIDEISEILKNLQLVSRNWVIH